MRRSSMNRLDTILPDGLDGKLRLLGPRQESPTLFGALAPIHIKDLAPQRGRIVIVLPLTRGTGFRR